MSPAATIDEAGAACAALDAADELFYGRGIVAVSMAQVRDRSGISMRRLYSLYPSKSALVAAWLRYRHESWMAGFAERVERRLTVSDAPVDAVFTALETWMTETDFRGCGFINTHAESSELTDEHRSIIRDHKQSLAAYLDTIVANGATIAVLVDGAIVQAAIFSDPTPIHLARRAAAALIAQDTT